MKMIKKLIAIALVAIAVLMPANSVSAAPNAQAQQQALLAQQIVNQQVLLFQAAGVTLTPEQLAVIQQNANTMAAQQLAALQTQQLALQAEALQAQQLQAAQALQAQQQAQQLAAIQAQQAAALQAQQLAALQTPLVQTRQTPIFDVPAQTTNSGTGSYVLNKNTKKFHYPSCSSVGDMSPKNRLDVTMSRDDIILQGYVPCKRCNP